MDGRAGKALCSDGRAGPARPNACQRRESICLRHGPVAIRRVEISSRFCAQITGIKLWINRAYRASPQHLQGLPGRGHFLIDIKQLTMQTMHRSGGLACGKAVSRWLPPLPALRMRALFDIHTRTRTPWLIHQRHGREARIGWGYAQKMWMKLCIGCSTQARSQSSRGLPRGG